jgi:hypothetical protein
LEFKREVALFGEKAVFGLRIHKKPGLLGLQYEKIEVDPNV